MALAQRLAHVRTQVPVPAPAHLPFPLAPRAPNDPLPVNLTQYFVEFYQAIYAQLSAAAPAPPPDFSLAGMLPYCGETLRLIYQRNRTQQT